MARELINELTWSVSRANLFRECERAYYYNYYGAWGGWKESAPDSTRLLYRLKNITTMPMWAGSIVHDVIAEALRRFSFKHTPIRAGELQAEARRKLRKGWSDAVGRKWVQTPKTTNLHELYYGNGKSLPREQTDRIKAKIYDCLKSFAESAILKEILSIPFINWKPVDKLDSFLVEDSLKIWCAVDFAFIDPSGTLRILDWKTGGEQADGMKTQLACYALYAASEWHMPFDAQRVGAVFLGEGARVAEYALEPADLVEAKNAILTSAAEMRARLVDVPGNVAVEEDFHPCGNERRCRRCNFLEVCPAAPDIEQWNRSSGTQ